MSGLNGGPSSQQLMAMGATSEDPTHGRAFGQALSDASLNARARYAAPAVPGPEKAAPGALGQNDENGIPSDYNMQGGYPVKYTGPTAQKERLMARQAIRDAVPKSQNDGVMRTDPITDEEVSYLQSMQDQIELADFDRWVGMKFNTRQPGQMKMLLDIYPEYVLRRLQQAKTDYDFSLRAQMISQWGINTFDDMHFQYLLDQGKIDGPRLARHKDIGSQYADGYLSPWKFANSQEGNLRAPFAAATWGKNAGDNLDNWAVSGEGQPMGTDRGMKALAENMYKPESRGPRGSVSEIIGNDYRERAMDMPRGVLI